MPRLVWLTTLSLALFAYGARPAPAEACSEAAPSITVADAPANGVVVLSIMCTLNPCVDEDIPDALPVVDVLSGEAVPGELLRTVDEEWRISVLWLPDAPLVAGRSYEVTWRPASNANFPFPEETNFGFRALPETDYDVTAPVFESQLDVNVDSTTALNCASVIIDSCGTSTQTIPLDRRTRPWLSLFVDPPLDVMIANAFEVRAAFWSGDEAPPALGPALWLGQHGMGHVFDEAAEQYCYRVELRSLIDDSTAVHEACVPHGDLGAIETIDATSEELARTLQNCVEPPSGYEAEWCSGTRERCAMAAANGWAAQGCTDFERRCAEIEPQPEPPAKPGPDPRGPDDRIPSPQPAGTGGGAAGSGGAAPDTDEPIRFRRADDPDRPRTAKYGCSAGGPAAHGTWAALALACVVLARRRRSVG